MDLDTALAWAADRKHCVLITLRSDGRAQSSDVVYDLADGTFSISLTDDRAKTANIRRDPRAVLHITEPSSWSYASFDGTVELTPVTTEPGDAASDALVELYQAINGGPHDDWDEYRQAMVDQRRLVARFAPGSVVGQVH